MTDNTEAIEKLAKTLSDAYLLTNEGKAVMILTEIRANPTLYVKPKPLVWTKCGYASFKFGPETLYYQVELADKELDAWSVEFGVIGSEFGGTEIHKCIGKEAAQAAAYDDLCKRVKELF